MRASKANPAKPISCRSANKPRRMKKTRSENQSRRQFLIGSGAALVLSQTANAQKGDKNSSLKDDCVFCQIIAGKLAAQKIWEDDRFLAFLDHKPINPGHTLLIPKNHYEYLFDLDEKTYSRMVKRARMLAKPLRAAMNSQRVGVLVEGFGVAHLHIHLVPINKGDGFGSRKGNPATEDELKPTAEKIRAAIAKR